MLGEPWKLFWEHLQLGYFHFADVGLALDARDSVVWETCQNEGLILITDNRNRKEPDSLGQPFSNARLRPACRYSPSATCRTCATAGSMLIASSTNSWMRYFGSTPYGARAGSIFRNRARNDFRR